MQRMDRDELTELHYITPIANIPSILQRGILSYRLADALDAISVADSNIQSIRARKRVPGTNRPLHDYANLYFDARNPMMYKRRNLHMALCVLRIKTGVLDLPDVIIADGNAASDYTRFVAAPAGLAIVDEDLVFASDWTHPDVIEYYQRKSAKCAEVLVPERVDFCHMFGAYISCQQSQATLRDAMNPASIGLDVEIRGHIFFQ